MLEANGEDLLMYVSLSMQNHLYSHDSGEKGVYVSTVVETCLYKAMNKKFHTAKYNWNPV